MSAALYTPEILALATELARWPLAGEWARRGEARSRACGSTLELGLSLDAASRVEGLGMRVRACAIGQAAAAIFAAGLPGRSHAELAAAEAALSDWLSGAAPPPDWPGIAALQPAVAYPGRHGAILLPWRAALSALSPAAA